MTGYVQFIDIIGENASRAPLVKGGLRAYYLTGSDGVEETAAQISAAKAAGMGVALIDQTPGLALFAEGKADIADVETNAGTPEAAWAAVQKRQAKGWQSTLYVSYGSLGALKAAVRDSKGVWYGVADYSWSLAEAEQLLSENGDWAYCQYGDNITNATTLVPGTKVTLAQACADIDVAKQEWAAQLLPATASPAAPVASEVTIPVTFGKRAAVAIDAIEAVGLHVTTSPERNPAREYTSAGSSPVGGTRVAKGSTVTLHVKLKG